MTADINLCPILVMFVEMLPKPTDSEMRCGDSPTYRLRQLQLSPFLLAIGFGSGADELVKYRREVALAFESEAGRKLRKGSGTCFEHTAGPRDSPA